MIYNNNTMGTELLVQIRQSTKYGSVMNDEIFNLHLLNYITSFIYFTTYSKFT